MLSLHHPSKRGFTLTELTVAVLIVFVLGLVLFPVFAKRKPKHRYSGCASNQKMIALGFLMYAQDYDEHYPPAAQHVDLRNRPNKPTAPPYVVTQSWGPDRKLPSGEILPGILIPYMKSNQLFIEPGDKTPSGDRYTTKYDPNVFTLHYMYNDLLAGLDQSTLSAVAKTVMTTDAENRFGNAGHAITLDSAPYEAKFNQQGKCDAGKGASIGQSRLRHTGGANFSFADGHLKWYKGGTGDQVFFPPHESASISAMDANTKQLIGPKPGGEMVFQGRQYDATFHVK